ncbi:MAG: cytochrome c-type biogenesis protein CcmH [Bryobacteraceae bacterium]
MIGPAALVALCLLAPADDVRRIQDRFLAPCCWRQSVAVHDSPVAREMRDEIATFASEGRTEEQIVDYYVARYGERILRQPRGQAWIWLNAGPIVASIAGLAAVVLFLARAKRPAGGSP